ncbi:MAG: acyltransferase, partial [Clostridia bacterium]|nr:acyltransferase [Clostridia bacterium]
MRRVERHPVPGGGNAMRHWPRLAGFWRTVRNTAVLTVARYVPWFGVKNAFYRLVGMQVEPGATVGFMAMFDIFFPHLVRVGANSIIGYNTTVLCHEFLIGEYRVGPVDIGRNVMIGANCTILPGVRIGDGAVVAAHSLVNRDVPAGAFAAGVPARIRARGEGPRSAAPELSVIHISEPPTPK